VIVYLDTSSLLKLYLEEEGRAEVVALRQHARVVSTSLVAYAEARAGLARARRDGRVTADKYDATLNAFQGDWSTFLAGEVTEPLVRLAGDLAAKHFLRGFDAIHLASAVTLQNELDEPVTFSASDGRLVEAAELEGLTAAAG
jgi:predicted nucleic acid-binding protein